jgi:hypothetical protein
LAIFDPHHAVWKEGGMSFSIKSPSPHADHLSGFQSLQSRFDADNVFQGTAVRLPLRTVNGAKRSLIKNKHVTSAEIQRLFEDFVTEEIGIALLFLNHIQTIEIHDVDVGGSQRVLAKVERIKSAEVPVRYEDVSCATYTCTISVTLEGQEPNSQSSWRIFRTTFPGTTLASLLEDRLKQDVSLTLQKHKLQPALGIAMPLSSQEILRKSGRLFTYLPLPLKTGFPCHIHGLFALTPDRQHLRNGEETGLVEGSDDWYEFDLQYLEGY